ncbi:hypothetical protein ACT17_34290 [Mycolicibacterium conceptionense]|uniref:Uncharacterized protein n=1 Tax=Mycolicibacterium conceptionense TaxID=451644 RepID=A0A0J8WKV1_9MYCO|nr:hypothetical protein [Mycolicibacterium conceptionense]KMV13624.1 hypothetical protein ACT17_34290 [Mycolicibacterium conceptionense]
MSAWIPYTAASDDRTKLVRHLPDGHFADVEFDNDDPGTVYWSIQRGDGNGYVLEDGAVRGTVEDAQAAATEAATRLFPGIEQ